MNPIETIVTDRKTSEDMYKAGINLGKSVYVWIFLDESLKHLAQDKGCNPKLILRSEWDEISSEAIGIVSIPAYTAGEMMKGLPNTIEFEGKTFHLMITTMDDKTCEVQYYNFDIKNFIYANSDKLPHQALAKLCLWCNKEGYV